MWPDKKVYMCNPFQKFSNKKWKQVNKGISSTKWKNKTKTPELENLGKFYVKQNVNWKISRKTGEKGREGEEEEIEEEEEEEAL